MLGIDDQLQDGPRHFRVVVENAGTALPLIVEKVKSSGVEIESAREHRLSFDEIFAILVSRHQDEVARSEAAAGDGDARTDDGPAGRPGTEAAA